MSKRKKRFFGCTVGAIVGLVMIVVGAGLFVVFGVSALTGAYFNNPWDRAKLRSLCNPLQNVPAVIDAHRTKHGRYPPSIADLDPSLPGSPGAMDAFADSEGFRYIRDDTGYRLYKKLNWDGGVGYSSLDGRWEYAIHDDIEWPLY